MVVRFEACYSYFWEWDDKEEKFVRIKGPIIIEAGTPDSLEITPEFIDYRIKPPLDPEKVLPIILDYANTERRKKYFKIFTRNSNLHPFFKSLSTYIDEFLKTVAYILKRRLSVRLRNLDSVEAEMKVSNGLAEHRKRLFVEYIKLLFGEVHVQKHFRLSNEQGFEVFEAFLKFSHFYAFLSIHQRCFKAIKKEINRVFRSERFQGQHPDEVHFTAHEKLILYGMKWKDAGLKANFYKNSPLALELLRDVPQWKTIIPWLGDLYKQSGRKIIDFD